jgi:hypothetical protein
LNSDGAIVMESGIPDIIVSMPVRADFNNDQVTDFIFVGTRGYVVFLFAFCDSSCFLTSFCFVP